MKKYPMELFEAFARAMGSSKEYLADKIDIVIDYADKGNIFNDVPIAKDAIGLLQIKDKLMQHKLKRNAFIFLKEIHAGKIDSVNRFEKMMRHEKKKAYEFADTTLSILVSDQRGIKSQAIAKLILSLGEGDITINEFDDMLLIIEAASIPAIKALICLDITKEIRLQEAASNQESLISTLGVGVRFGTQYSFNEFGKKLHKCLSRETALL